MSYVNKHAFFTSENLHTREGKHELSFWLTICGMKSNLKEKSRASTHERISAGKAQLETTVPPTRRQPQD